MSDFEHRLMEAADRVKQVETAYYRAVTEWEEAKMNCAIREAELIECGKINMKNPDTRNADLWKYAKEERKMVRIKETKVDSLKSELHYRQSVLNILLVSAKLHGGVESKCLEQS
ncbi:hypothetical protein ACOJUR_11935 [Alicyclobacillus tolerans]|uniref:hypothetical protein n=1 Tax=Alicyclobacillus tolerans TaxID=90970 RepID=UPI003B80343C